MDDDSSSSSEYKSAGEETWQGNVVSSESEETDSHGNRFSPVSSEKVEPTVFSAPKLNDDQPQEAESDSLSELEKNPIATERPPWKSSLVTAANRANQSLNIRKGQFSIPNFSIGVRNEDPNIQNPPSRRIRKPKPKGSPDMVLLKQLQSDREQASKGSFDIAQKVIHHIPRKLRRNILVNPRDRSSVGEDKNEESFRAVQREEKTPTKQTSKGQNWNHFYVGSVPLPDSVPSVGGIATGNVGQDPSTGGTRDVSSSEGLGPGHSGQKMIGSPQALEGLARIRDKFDPNQKTPRKWRKDLPSLLEKSYSFSPVGLRAYGNMSDAISMEGESVSFLTHLRFLLDGKVEVDTCHFNRQQEHPRPIPEKKDTDGKPKVSANPNPKARMDSKPKIGAKAKPAPPKTTPEVVPKVQQPRQEPNPPAPPSIPKGVSKPKGRMMMMMPGQEPKTSVHKRLFHPKELNVKELSSKLESLDQSEQQPGAIGGCQRWVPVLLLILSFGLIGRTWQSFLQARRNPNVVPPQRSPNEIPTLDGYFYTKDVQEISLQKFHDLDTFNETLQRRRDGKPKLVYPIQELHQRSFHDKDMIGKVPSSSSFIQTTDDDVISKSRPFVATRTTHRPAHVLPRPDKNDVRVARILIHPFLWLYQFFQKFLRVMNPAAGL